MAKKKRPGTGRQASAGMTALESMVATWHLGRLGTITPDDPTRSLVLLAQAARQRRGDEPGEAPSYGEMVLMLLSAAQCEGITVNAVMVLAATAATAMLTAAETESALVQQAAAESTATAA